MEYSLVHRSAAAERDPLAALLLTEGDGPLPGSGPALDDALGGLIARVRGSEFTGKAGETTLLHNTGDTGPERVLLVGLGAADKVDAEAVRRAAGTATRAARAAKCGSLAVVVPQAAGVTPAAMAEALVEGACLAAYDFLTLKSGDARTPKHPLVALTLVNDADGDGDALQAGLDLGRVLADATAWARDVGNTPGNEATPTHLAALAEEFAKETGLRCEILDRPQMEELGMGGLLGVAAGSEQPPKFIILEHNAGRDDLDTICLVGKGITFDSGGISIKPAANMHEMKFDKCGGVAVLAAMRAIGALKPDLHVVGLVPATENLPSGTAYKPGDVVTSMLGKTVEVLNTDAEGRMILIDALSYARKYEPKAIVDLATLTGACVVALGDAAAGLFSTHDDLVEELEDAADMSGERVWRMPLYADYTDQIKSDVADYKNTGGRWAGACTAAALLQAHAEGMRWAHLDIAGVAWGDKDRHYVRKGATGYGPRLLVHWLLARAGG